MNYEKSWFFMLRKFDELISQLEAAERNPKLKKQERLHLADRLITARYFRSLMRSQQTAIVGSKENVMNTGA